MYLQHFTSLLHDEVIFLWVSFDRGYGYAAHRGVGNAVGQRPMLETGGSQKYHMVGPICFETNRLCLFLA